MGSFVGEGGQAMREQFGERGHCEAVTPERSRYANQGHAVGLLGSVEGLLVNREFEGKLVNLVVWFFQLRHRCREDVRFNQSWGFFTPGDWPWRESRTRVLMNYET